LSADWIREVSGGADSALEENCSLLVARVALSGWHVAGTLGWPGGVGEEEGLADGLGDADFEGDVDADGLGVGEDPEADGVGPPPPLQATPFSVNAVGSAFELV
jgi:hypothetical protein